MPSSMRPEDATTISIRGSTVSKKILFLAPGEGDAVVANGNGAEGRTATSKPGDAMSVLRGDIR